LKTPLEAPAKLQPQRGSQIIKHYFWAKVKSLIPMAQIYTRNLLTNHFYKIFENKFSSLRAIKSWKCLPVEQMILSAGVENPSALG
jgi:hypothetical protein